MKKSPSIKIYLILATICLMSFKLLGQEDNFFSINLGLSMPLSDFSNTTIDGESGFAQNGLGLSIESVHYFTPNFGLGGVGMFLFNKFDSDAFSESFMELDPGGTILNLDSRSYFSTNVYAGAYLKFDLSDNFLILTKYRIGGLYFSRMRLDASWQDSNGSQNLISIKRARGIAFSYGGGIGVLYRISDKIGTTINADFISGNPKYSYWVTEPDGSLNIVVDRKSVSYLLLTWGIAIFIGPDF